MPICYDLKDQMDSEEIFCNQKWLGRDGTQEKDVAEIVEILGKNKCVKMALANNMLSGKSVPPIVEALAANTSLIFFSLANNDLGDEGVAQFTAVLEKNTTLKQLALGGNKATEKCCDELWAVNEKRETPMTDNLYGLIIDHFSPARRAKQQEIKEAAKGKKKTIHG